MDGGRVLRALLAKRLDHAKATKIAAQVGQGFALLMGLWGFMSGSWTFVIIAIFVWMGAGQESQGETFSGVPLEKAFPAIEELKMKLGSDIPLAAFEA